MIPDITMIRKEYYSVPQNVNTEDTQHLSSSNSISSDEITSEHMINTSYVSKPSDDSVELLSVSKLHSAPLIISKLTFFSLMIWSATLGFFLCYFLPSISIFNSLNTKYDNIQYHSATVLNTINYDNNNNNSDNNFIKESSLSNVSALLNVLSQSSKIPQYRDFSVSEAVSCLNQVNGDILLMGNSIMRGVFAFLNAFVNEWPELSREQQKTLCEKDDVSGSYTKNCNFSQFDQKIPIYFDLMIHWCEEKRISEFTSDPRWKLIWVQLGQWPIARGDGKWPEHALDATTCVPRVWKNWTSQEDNILTYSTPTEVCSENIWNFTHNDFKLQVANSSYSYIIPSFERAGAHILDLFGVTSTSPSDFDCSHYGPDKLHPANLYPRIAALWLSDICKSYHLPPPIEGELTLLSIEYGVGSAKHGAPIPSVEPAMPVSNGTKIEDIWY